jgi:hypothetical protein
MRLPHNDSAELIRELAGMASASKDKSLFSLLLLLEEQTCETAFNSEVLLGTPRTSTGLNRQRPVFVTHSRYVE